jgi:hypothetical protein
LEEEYFVYVLDCGAEGELDGSGQKVKSRAVKLPMATRIGS